MSSTTISQQQLKIGTWGIKQARVDNGGRVDAYLVKQRVAENTPLTRSEVDDVIQSDRVGLRGPGNEKVVTVDTYGEPPADIDYIDLDDTNDQGTSQNSSDSEADTPDDLTELADIEANQATALQQNGFETFSDIHDASIDELTDTATITPPLAEQIKQEAATHLDSKELIFKSARERALNAQGDSDDDTENERVVTDIEIPAGDPVPLDAEDPNFHYIHRLQNPDECDGRHPETPDPENFEVFYPRYINTSEDAVTQQMGVYRAPENPQDGETVTEVVTRFMAKGRPVNLVGHAGLGKDTILKRIFAERNQPVIVFNMDRSMIPEDLLGIHSISSDGTIVFEDGPLLHAVKHGWGFVVDEINAGEGGVLPLFQQILEEDGKLFVKGKNEAIEPHPEFQFCSTMNPPTSDYQGVAELNDALDSRLNNIWVPYNCVNDEINLLLDKANSDDREVLTYEEAEALVKTADDFREKARTTGGIRISPRHLYEVADWYDGAHNSPLSSALQETIRTIGGTTVDRESELEFAADKLAQHLT